MRAYIVLYFVKGKPDFMILQANSNEDAVKKADIHPKLIYHVSTYEEWEKFNIERRGMYK
jgi:hypothetical protein